MELEKCWLTICLETLEGQMSSFSEVVESYEFNTKFSGMICGRCSHTHQAIIHTDEENILPRRGFICKLVGCPTKGCFCQLFEP